jgi:hypothetical protein
MATDTLLTFTILVTDDCAHKRDQLTRNQNIDLERENIGCEVKQK